MQKRSLNLSNLSAGESGYITKINEKLKIKTRLLELGFTKGTLVRVLNVSSLKNSYLLEIRGYILAIRHNAVKLIEIIPTKEEK